MLKKIDDYIAEVDSFNSSDNGEIEQFRIKFLSKKGIVSLLFSEFKDIPVDQKKAFGNKINLLKNKAAEKIDSLKTLSEADIPHSSSLDLSLPSDDSRIH